MASILRSSKFVRYIAGFARNVVLNTPREFDGNFVNNTTHCYCGAIPRTLATQASIQHDQNLERRLKSLDQDVRRSGRISRRDIEDVLEEIRTSRSATSSQSLLVIRCCGNLVPEELPEIRTKLVQEIWNTLNKLNIPMDISHYNALLRVYLENEHPFSPTEFLSELESKGIEPNRVTYQRLIARYCQEGDIEGATRILEFMREKQLPVNENVFNALIMGHSQSGDMESARGILNVMVQAGLEPSADTYTTLLCGYGKQGDVETIQSLLDECDQKEIFLLDKDYLDIAYALATNGFTEHVPVILTKVRKAVGYNQDAINLILRLINKGLEDAAYLVLNSMQRGETVEGSKKPLGAFFVKQLVKANRPVQTIIEYSERLENEGYYKRGLFLATEISLELGNDTVAYALLEELQKRGVEVRQHYFWPLIVAKASDPTGTGVLEVLDRMHTFGLTPNSETLREYVIPNLRGSSVEILNKLRMASVSLGSAACALVVHLLHQGDIEQAAVITGSVTAYYVPEMVKKPLTNAFYRTRNSKAYASVLRHVYDNLERRGEVLLEDGSKNSVTKEEVLGNFVLDLAQSQRQFADVIEDVLLELVDQGLSISTSAADKIQDKLGEKLTEEISNLLSKLTSGELTPKPIVAKKFPSYVPSSQMNIPQLERLIQNLDAKNQDTRHLKRQLVTLYCRAKETDKIDALLKNLGEDFEPSPGNLANLIDAYACNQKLEETEKYLEKLKASDPEFLLDDLKILHVAQMYVKHGKMDEAVAFIENVKCRRQQEIGFVYSNTVWRMLNSLAEEGKTEELMRLFETLEKNNLLEPTNVVLGPLVKVHVLKDDLDKALEVFEWCCLKYRATPWKNELACKLIQEENAEKLQKLTDLSTAVHGEINSLYDLVFAFVECGRIRQARKILETPGLHVRPQKINNVCEHYRHEGMIKQLEGLKDATKDLTHIDRTDIYYQLLLSYTKQEDVDKSLGLWTQMQEEDVAPNDQFLITLGNFLKKRGVEVPFVIPTSSKTEPTTSNTERTSRARTRAPLKEQIYAGDVDRALEMYRNGPELSISDTSLLIEKLLQNDRLNEATKITLQMLEKGVHPIQRVFRFLLNKLATNGDVETLEAIGRKIDSELKKLVSFDNRICHANVVSGNVEGYLKKLEQAIDDAKDEELQFISEQFPRGGANGILEKHPEFLDKFKEIALKYVNRGVVSPINVLWAHHFINGQDADAEVIWKQHLQNAPRIMFQRVVQAARDSQDETLANKLIEHLKESKVTEGAIGNAYSCLLDILVAKNRIEEVVQTFEKALENVHINSLNRTAVLRVKEAYEKLNKRFDYQVPARVNKGESSSSGTSSDEPKK